jgi:hypothetical protein
MYNALVNNQTMTMNGDAAKGIELLHLTVKFSALCL